MLDKWGSNPASLRLRAAACVFLGRIDEARVAMAELLRLQPNASVQRPRRLYFRNAEMIEIFVCALPAAGLPE
jgi:hypothetical protein